MKIFYSKIKHGFYPSDLHSDYLAAGTLPEDLVEVSAEHYAAIQAGISKGMALTADEDGAPCVTPLPAVPYEVLADSVYDHYRLSREVTLNRLQGIGFAAMCDGNSPATIQACLSARTALLNATGIKSTDVASLKAALQVEYDRIVAAAPASIRNAFVKLNFN